MMNNRSENGALIREGTLFVVEEPVCLRMGSHQFRTDNREIESLSMGFERKEMDVNWLE